MQKTRLSQSTVRQRFNKIMLGVVLPILLAGLD
jgi:hypothetical protein